MFVVYHLMRPARPILHRSHLNTKKKKVWHPRVRRGEEFWRSGGVEISWPNLRMRVSRDYPRSPRDFDQLGREGVFCFLLRETDKERNVGALITAEG